MVNPWISIVVLTVVYLVSAAPPTIYLKWFNEFDHLFTGKRVLAIWLAQIPLPLFIGLGFVFPYPTTSVFWLTGIYGSICVGVLCALAANGVPLGRIQLFYYLQRLRAFMARRFVLCSFGLLACS